MPYDAFISYSHESVELADALQSSLQRLSMPWYRRKPFIRVFRDATSFGAGHDLGDKITGALDESDHLVLILSPDSAASPWVDHEVQHFLATRGPEHVTFVVERWRGDAGRAELGKLTGFDWDGEDVPPSARGQFEEPLAVDMRWTVGAGDLTLKNERFRDDVATVAAAIKGQNKDELVGAIVAMQTRARILTGSIALGALILLMAIAVAVPGWLSARSAQRSAEAAVVEAESRLDDLDRQLATAQLDLDDAEATLLQTEALLGSAENELELASANLAAVESDLTSTQAERDQARADRDTAAAERDAAAAARDEAAAARDVAIGERDVAAAARDAAVTARDAAVSERDTARTARDAAVSERDTARTARDAAVSERDSAITERDTAEDARDAAEANLQQAEAQLDDAEADLAAAETNLAAVEADLTSTQAERDQARADRDAAAAERDAAAAARDAALEEVDLQVAVGESVRLAVESTRVFDENVELAALLALQSANATASFPAPAQAPPSFSRSATESVESRPFVSGSAEAAMHAVAASAWRTYLDEALSTAFSPTDDLLVATSSDGTATLLDLYGNPQATLVGHTGRVLSARFSSDGGSIVTAGDDGTSRVWNLQGDEILQLAGHTGAVNDARFDPSGNRILTAGSDGLGQIWDVSGALEATLGGHAGGVASAAFSPDGRAIVTVSGDGRARVWNVEGTLRSDLLGHTDSIVTANFHPDGSRVVTASADTTAKIWNLDGTEVATLAYHTDAVVTAEYSPDGEWIVTASRDGTGSWWHADGTRWLRMFGHTAPLTSASFAPDSIHVLTTSEDGSAQIFSRHARHPDESIRVLYSRRSSVSQERPRIRHGAFSHDGLRMVTLDAETVIWDLADGLITDLTDTSNGHSDRVVATAFSPDGTHVATASMDGTAKVWDLEGNQRSTFTGHGNQWIRTIEFSPDGSSILTAGGNTARVWDLDGNERAELELLVFLWSASFSPDGSRIVGVTSAGEAAVLDLASNERIDLTGPGGGVGSARFSPDGRLVVTTNNFGDENVRVWDVDGNVVGRIDAVAVAADFSPDGTHVVTANTDATATVWTLGGELVTTLEGHTARVTSVQFSPDGTRIVTASDDGTGKVWGANGGLQATLYDPSFGGIGGSNNIGVFFPPSAEFTADGRRVVTSGGRIWDLTGIPLASFGHEALVSSTSVSPDGRHAATTNAGAGFRRDNAAQIWRVHDSTSLVDELQRRLRDRQLSNDECLLYRIQPCPSAG